MKKNVIPEFIDEAIKLIIEREYSVIHVAECLDVFQHSIHRWPNEIQPFCNI